MGFLTGVVSGIAAAAVAAAWYMSRSGKPFRDQYRVERRLGELGDQMEARSREIQSQVNAQLAEMRAKGKDAASDAGATLDATQAAAAEAAAKAAAEVDAATAEADTVVRKARKAATDGPGEGD
jgi:gas vesicle protein